jgi:hypothetical protein
MSQTITFKNPTGETVAYQSRDCRVKVPASDSITQVLNDDVAARVVAHFKRHHPLISTSVDEPVAAEAESEKDAAPAAKSKRSAPARKVSDRAKTGDDGSKEATQ